MLAPGCLIIDQTGGEEMSRGYNECGDFGADGTVYCQPGEYCEDPTFSDCKPGCLSNENCAEDQRCVKSDGRQVGACQNKGKQERERSGVVQCGEFAGETQYCQPGQYCEDATFSDCEPGCLGDYNCPPEEICFKAMGEDVGSCNVP
jgi:hypothetical protein